MSLSLSLSLGHNFIWFLPNSCFCSIGGWKWMCGCKHLHTLTTLQEESSGPKLSIFICFIWEFCHKNFFRYDTLRWVKNFVWWISGAHVGQKVPIGRRHWWWGSIKFWTLNFNFGALFRQNKAPERHLTPFLDQLDALHNGSIALRISEITKSKGLDFAQLWS